jgi:hypothetical protein
MTRFEITYLKRAAAPGGRARVERLSITVEAEDANTARQSVAHDDDTISIESVHKLRPRPEGYRG